MQHASAVVSALLGHAKGDVTDGYIDVPIEAQLAALNWAAFLLDASAQENVVPLVPKTAVKTAVRA